MKHVRGSTTFLKIVLLAMGIAVLALCIFVLPGIAGRDAEAHPETAYLQYPFLICAYLLCMPLFSALYQACKLLTYVEKGKTFSGGSVRALQIIKRCAITIIVCVAAGLLFGILWIGGDIAGVVMLVFICITVSSIIAACASIFQKVLQDAIDLQSQLDQTVII
ncbi:DUF2975 domain-containing protein [Paenibacillus hexagrammi]|uniref:DUF2975 domain-containing protein n=1 Tax=Paenibacillus hexagrammi TaxID=2908839 RepID=A0ABY3SIW0_9BACL|nr:DUF2975 domain-containing protein [Paenibacillus sp. YPD9-1]UJF33938.1 DUF2975 domain-containing protein [Paenibacillus sp. YPD9-1]